jgi:hypothetical protein
MPHSPVGTSGGAWVSARLVPDPKRNVIADREAPVLPRERNHQRDRDKHDRHAQKHLAPMHAMWGRSLRKYRSLEVRHTRMVGEQASRSSTPGLVTPARVEASVGTGFASPGGHRWTHMERCPRIERVQDRLFEGEEPVLHLMG